MDGHADRKAAAIVLLVAFGALVVAGCGGGDATGDGAPPVAADAPAAAPPGAAGQATATDTPGAAPPTTTTPASGTVPQPPAGAGGTAAARQPGVAEFSKAKALVTVVRNSLEACAVQNPTGRYDSPVNCVDPAGLAAQTTSAFEVSIVGTIPVAGQVQVSGDATTYFLQSVAAGAGGATYVAHRTTSDGASLRLCGAAPLAPDSTSSTRPTAACPTGSW